MTQNRDKPADPDPDATATFQLSALQKPDEDATVMLPSRSALKKPDDDATVMIPPGGLKAALAAEAESAKSPGTPPGTPRAAFRTDADPEATVVAPQSPSSVPPMVIAEQQPSRMPMIAGGLVVVAVILYFVFSGDKKPTQAPAPGIATTTAPASVVAPAAPPVAAPATAPITPAAAPAAAPITSPAATAAAPAGGRSSIEKLLAEDVKRGDLNVTEEAGRVSISIAEANQFASGGVDPEAKLRPVLLSIASALNKTAGSIVVTGHADASPSSNPKFPSNQALSAARAASAARVMMPRLSDPKRLTSEGAADSQPLAPSDTTANRAKNRRVVIVFKPAS